MVHSTHITLKQTSRKLYFEYINELDQSLKKEKNQTSIPYFCPSSRQKNESTKELQNRTERHWEDGVLGNERVAFALGRSRNRKEESEMV